MLILRDSHLLASATYLIDCNTNILSHNTNLKWNLQSLIEVWYKKKPEVALCTVLQQIWITFSYSHELSWCTHVIYTIYKHVTVYILKTKQNPALNLSDIFSTIYKKACRKGTLPVPGFYGWCRALVESDPLWSWSDMRPQTASLLWDKELITVWSISWLKLLA